MPLTRTTKKIGLDLHIALVLMAAGSAMAVTTWLLRTSRFASIENRSEKLGPELYSELAPALPMEQILVAAGAIIALLGALLLLTRRIAAKQSV